MLVLSHVQVFVIPWAVACQAPLSMEFCRQEYWSGKYLQINLNVTKYMQDFNTKTLH